MNNTIALGITGILIALVAVYAVFFRTPSIPETPLDATPYTVTLSGTYVCLPHLDPSVQTKECAFGLKTDEGDYYAVNFGQSASSSEQFQSRAHITAEGFVVIREALSTDQWQQYNMKGLFTITKMISSAPVQGKLDINAVCNNAIAHMKFADAASADAFLKDCKDGKHPEVIEHYKAQMDLDGATI